MGHIGVDVDSTIQEWREDRKKLGLPESPSEGNQGPPGAKKDEGEDESDEDDEESKDEDDDDE